MTWEQISPTQWFGTDGEGNTVFVSIREGLDPAPILAAHENGLPPDDALTRTVAKSVIVARLIEAGKIEAAYAALTADPAAWARWVASDRPAINHNDPDAIALLIAIGADPDVILGP